MRKFSTAFDSDYWMKNNGFYCGFNTPNAKKEGDRTLPEYARRKVFLTDHYHCPNNWMRSEGTTKSYFVGVPMDKGMWLDFNKNSENLYDVAIVMSIQGINPITGLPCHDMQMEQYIENCPKCKKPFGADRYCEECGYHWPKQNYICSNAQPLGQLWIDGFRAVDGIIRQYIFTEEKMKGVANSIIGEDRVFAIGLSFFLSKTKKPEKPSMSLSPYGDIPIWHSPTHKSINWGPPISNPTWNSNTTIEDHIFDEKITYCSSSGNNITRSLCSSNIELDWMEETLSDQAEETIGKTIVNTSALEIKKVEVGAGNQIDQKIYDDPESLDYWRDKPEAQIVINYCVEEQAEQILKQGKIEQKIKENGFLEGIPVS